MRDKRSKEGKGSEFCSAVAWLSPVDKIIALRGRGEFGNPASPDDVYGAQGVHL